MKYLLHKLFEIDYVFLQGEYGKMKIKRVRHTESGPAARWELDGGWVVLFEGGKVDGNLYVTRWFPCYGKVKGKEKK